MKRIIAGQPLDQYAMPYEALTRRHRTKQHSSNKVSSAEISSEGVDNKDIFNLSNKNVLPTELLSSLTTQLKSDDRITRQDYDRNARKLGTHPVKSGQPTLAQQQEDIDT